MANKEALHKVLAHIKDNPNDWDQHRWHACFAGWTLQLCMPGIEVRTDEFGIEMLHDADAGGVHPRDIADWARSLLGLSEAQSYGLFSQHNDLADLERIVAEIAAAETAVPA
jgi:hypothetical protein